jgi:hypothetical protein
MTQKPIQRKFDVVYTWVDPTEASYINAYRQLFKSSIRHPIKRRYCSLKYSLRSINKYGTCLGKIFIVVSHGQRPTWLNTKHPSIKIIDDDTIFENKQNLPCFNSNAIECQLHKIPGLSDQFLYFNDDTYLGNQLEYSDVIDANGLLQLHLRGDGNYSINHPVNCHQQALQNTRELVLSSLGNQFYDMPHVAAPLSRTSFAELWKNPDIADVLNRLVATPMVSGTDILPMELNLHLALYQGLGTIKQSISECFVELNAGDDGTAKLQRIMDTNPQYFCININVDIHHHDEVLEQCLTQFLENKYSQPAPWETHVRYMST